MFPFFFFFYWKTVILSELFVKKTFMVLSETFKSGFIRKDVVQEEL